MNREIVDNKKIIWLKDRFFLVLLVLGGILYLTISRNWQLYTEPLIKLAGRYGITIENPKANPGIAEKESNYTWVKSKDIWLIDDVAQVDVFGEGNWISAQALPEDIRNAMEGNVPQENMQPGVPGEEMVLPEEEPGAEMPTEVTPEPTEVPTPEPTYRDPSEVVYANVEDSYFSDAVFIGDSRTVGMREYGGLSDISTFYAATGLSVHKLFEKDIVEVPETKEKITVEEALQINSFEKIYLMIGINEMGTGTVESFMEKYKAAVERLRELQPDAIIYLQAIMKVSEKRSNQGDYIHNEGIDARNAEIAKLADNVHVYYLDINESICDENGAMDGSYTHDGVHLKAQYVSLWKEYLKSHAVSME